MASEKQYLSKEKHDELVKELDYLKHTRRREVAESLEYAKSLGDLSENSEYQEARENQAGIEERISTLENLLKTAIIIAKDKKNGDKVDVGSIVIVKKSGGAKEQRYHVVGSEEANMAEAKISNQSPLGEAMIGRKAGESFSFKTPAGEVSYKIISVE